MTHTLGDTTRHTTHPDSWMLDLVADVRGVRHAVVLSSDGLVKVRTDATDPDTADRSRRRAPGSSPWP
jgi:predicted regulator of Ras-like GTPase activity (Roadblock/LC7/MglB family)